MQQDLIEVLVSITIIGLLLSVVYINFSDARQESSNRAWRVELKELELALEVFKAQHGFYPSTQISTTWNSLGCWTDVNGNVISASSRDVRSSDGQPCPTNTPVIEHRTGSVDQPAGTIGLTSEYIDVIPRHEDSANSNCELIYRVPDVTDNEDRTWYKFVAVNCLAGVDATSGVQSDDEFALCPESCRGTCNSDVSGVEFHESLAIYSRGGRRQ